jgi:hypothetical protein
MALVGVNRNKNGFRQIDVGTGVIPDTGGRSDNIVMKSRAIINSNQPISGTLDCWTDDGLRVFLNNNMLINAWYDQGPTYHNCTINIPANTPTPFEINWYENKGGATLIMRNVITKLNPAMRLPFSKQSAIIALDFFRGSMNDVHDAVKVQNFGCSIQSRGGRSCVNISNKNYIQILTPIRRKLCKTFTCMVWWDTLPSSVTSFSLCRENNYNNRLIQLIHNNKLTTAEWRLNYYNSVSSARDGVNTVGKWIHYAVEWTPLDYGTTLFVNGKQVATKDDPNIPFPDDILQYIFLGRLPPISGMTGVDINKNRSLDVDQQMNIAWFHIYDYALTEKELQQEMKYWDSDEFAKAAPVPPYIAPRFTNWVF